jgi:hypothetical protein
MPWRGDKLSCFVFVKSQVRGVRFLLGRRATLFEVLWVSSSPLGRFWDPALEYNMHFPFYCYSAFKILSFNVLIYAQS